MHNRLQIFTNYTKRIVETSNYFLSTRRIYCMITLYTSICSWINVCIQINRDNGIVEEPGTQWHYFSSSAIWIIGKNLYIWFLRFFCGYINFSLFNTFPIGIHIQQDGFKNSCFDSYCLVDERNRKAIK